MAVTPYSLVHTRPLGGRFFLQIFAVFILTMEAVGSSEPLMHIYGTLGRQSPEEIYWHK
jgi:hypothetical protein